jgi:predicted metalloendopeptidase
VDAVDRESTKNPAIEDELKRLLAMANIKELDAKLGQVYNPDLHELVISNDPSLVTDREQKITKVISRGLILPNGKIIKAKVSIQKKI